MRVEAGVKVSIVETISGKTRKMANDLCKSAEVTLEKKFKIDLGRDKNTGWSWAFIGIIETKEAREIRLKKLMAEKSK